MTLNTETAFAVMFVLAISVLGGGCRRSGTTGAPGVAKPADVSALQQELLGKTEQDVVKRLGEPITDGIMSSTAVKTSTDEERDAHDRELEFKRYKGLEYADFTVWLNRKHVVIAIEKKGEAK